MKYTTTRSSVPGNRIGEPSRIDHESLKSELNDFAGLNLLNDWWESNCDDDDDDDIDGDSFGDEEFRVLGDSKRVRSLLTFPLREVPADSIELYHFFIEASFLSAIDEET